MKISGKGKITLTGTLILAATILAAAGASAEVIKYLEFNSDGVLPSADPQIAFTATAGVVETDVFSVNGGVLTGSYPGGNSFPITYAYPGEFLGGSPINGGISPTEPWSVEIRARVLENRGGTFTVWNGNRRFSIFFFATGVRVTRGHALAYLDYPCDISQWHVLRMWSNDGDKFYASVDGVEFASNQNGINDANAINGFYVRLNPHSDPAHVEWDYVRFESGQNAVATENVSFGAVKALYR